eukprot:9499026-Pyramimonas_sp.AAC.1
MGQVTREDARPFRAPRCKKNVGGMGREARDTGSTLDLAGPSYSSGPTVRPSFVPNSPDPRR